MKLLIEGWRHYSHSLSLVNQYQCLEILKHENINIFHRDLPPPPSSILRKGSQWPKQKGLMREKLENKIRSIPSPSRKILPDIVYRIAFPYNFSPAIHGKTYVFAVTETGLLPNFLIQGVSLKLATKKFGVQIITPSYFSQNGLVASGATPKSISVIPHGFDPQTFYPLKNNKRKEIRKKFGWKNKFVFLSVGAMYPHKGTFSLLKSFARMALKHPDIILVLKGNDSIYSSLQSLKNITNKLSSQELHLIQSRITYIGKTVTAEKMAHFYQAADILLAPYHAEGFNLPVIEAAACGLPVICSKNGPTDETTIDAFALKIPSKKVASQVKGWGGYWLIPDQEVLIAQMGKAVTDSTYLCNGRKAASKHMIKNYTWTKIVEKLIQLFQ